MSKNMFCDRKVSHFFWDFDGCFCDSEPAHKKAYILAFQEVGHKLDEESYFEIFTHLGAGPRYVIEKHNLKITEQEVRSKKCKIYEEIIKTGEAKIYPEIPKILEKLCDKGVVNFIVTNSPEADIRTILSQHNPLPIAKILTPVDGIRKKPHPDIYLKALEVAGISAESAIVVEDSQRGLQAAEGAGIDAVWISTENSEKFQSEAAYLKKLTHKELLQELNNVDG